VSTGHFAKSGVSFRYPAEWAADEEGDDDNWTFTLQSPGTAFLLISLRPDADDPAQVADQTLEALKAEYPELDATDATETIAGRLAIGHDVDFVALDATVSGRVRAIDAPDGPLLILTQCGDLDRAKHEPTLKAVVASLEITDV
jgi:hypothetical protein